MSTFSGLLILAILAALWVNAMRAREIAVRACVKGCRERGVQLLDQTVALSRVRLHSKGKLRLRRVYRFEFSEQGLERYSGHVTLIGRHVVEISLGLPTPAPDDEAASQGGEGLGNHAPAPGSRRRPADPASDHDDFDG